MVKQIFDNRPEPIQNLGTGYFNIHFNIEETTQELINEESGTPEIVTRYAANVERVKSIEYGDIVCRLIRKRYTDSNELSLLRQRDDKPAEWQAYFDYCEECKQIARQILNINK